MNDKLEIYKVAVELADRVSSRRMTANAFFVTVETALLALFAFFLPRVATGGRQWALVVVTVIGMVLAAAWFLSIRSYRRLNRAKFAVINAIEKDLPLQYFTDEWKQLKGLDATEPKSVRERWIRFADRYTDLTAVETIIPVLFGIINAVGLVAVLFKVVV